VPSLSTLGLPKSVGDSGVTGLFRVGRSTGFKSLPAAPPCDIGAVGTPVADGVIGAARVGGGPVKGVKFEFLGCAPAVPAGGIDGIGIAW